MCRSLMTNIAFTQQRASETIQAITQLSGASSSPGFESGISRGPPGPSESGHSRAAAPVQRRVGRRSAVLGPLLPSVGEFGGSGPQLPHLSNGGGMDFKIPEGLSSVKTDSLTFLPLREWEGRTSLL